jgi:hypothetical protein
MAKRKAEVSLILDHGKAGINPIPLRAGGMQHTIGKLSTKDTTSV